MAEGLGACLSRLSDLEQWHAKSTAAVESTTDTSCEPKDPSPPNDKEQQTEEVLSLSLHLPLSIVEATKTLLERSIEGLKALQIKAQQQQQLQKFAARGSSSGEEGVLSPNSLSLQGSMKHRKRVSFSAEVIAKADERQAEETVRLRNKKRIASKTPEFKLPWDAQKTDLASGVLSYLRSSFTESKAADKASGPRNGALNSIKSVTNALGEKGDVTQSELDEAEVVAAAPMNPGDISPSMSPSTSSLMPTGALAGKSSYQLRQAAAVMKDVQAPKFFEEVKKESAEQNPKVFAGVITQLVRPFLLIDVEGGTAVNRLSSFVELLFPFIKPSRRFTTITRVRTLAVFLWHTQLHLPDFYFSLALGDIILTMFAAIIADVGSEGVKGPVHVPETTSSKVLSLLLSVNEQDAPTNYAVFVAFALQMHDFTCDFVGYLERVLHLFDPSKPTHPVGAPSLNQPVFDQQSATLPSSAALQRVRGGLLAADRNSYGEVMKRLASTKLSGTPEESFARRSAFLDAIMHLSSVAWHCFLPSVELEAHLLQWGEEESLPSGVTASLDSRFEGKTLEACHAATVEYVIHPMMVLLDDKFFSDTLISTSDRTVSPDGSPRASPQPAEANVAFGLQCLPLSWIAQYEENCTAAGSIQLPARDVPTEEQIAERKPKTRTLNPLPIVHLLLHFDAETTPEEVPSVQSPTIELPVLSFYQRTLGSKLYDRSQCYYIMTRVCHAEMIKVMRAAEDFSAPRPLQRVTDRFVQGWLSCLIQLQAQYSKVKESRPFVTHPTELSPLWRETDELEEYFYGPLRSSVDGTTAATTEGNPHSMGNGGNRAIPLLPSVYEERRRSWWNTVTKCTPPHPQRFGAFLLDPFVVMISQLAVGVIAGIAERDAMRPDATEPASPIRRRLSREANPTPAMRSMIDRFERFHSKIESDAHAKQSWEKSKKYLFRQT